MKIYVDSMIINLYNKDTWNKKHKIHKKHIGNKKYNKYNGGL